MAKTPPVVAANNQPAADTETVKARILVACVYGEPNDVVALNVEQITSLVGVVDADPAAVAYAESLGQ